MKIDKTQCYLEIVTQQDTKTIVVPRKEAVDYLVALDDKFKEGDEFCSFGLLTIRRDQILSAQILEQPIFEEDGE